MVTTRPPKTIVKPTALGPGANTDTKLLIYGLFQKGRVLAQDGGTSENRVLGQETCSYSGHHFGESMRTSDGRAAPSITFGAGSKSAM